MTGAEEEPFAHAYPVLPPARLTRRSVWALTLGLPALLVLVVTALGTMAPSAVGPQTLGTNERGIVALVVLGLILVIGTPLALVLQSLLRQMQVRFDGGELQVRAGWHELRLPLSAIDLPRARIVDLDEHIELRPAYRTRALALPGLRAGHYRLRNLRRRAFCLLTSMRRVLVLPRHEGHVVLLSLVRPQALLDAMREASGRSGAVSGAQGAVRRPR